MNNQIKIGSLVMTQSANFFSNFDNNEICVVIKIPQKNQRVFYYRVLNINRNFKKMKLLESEFVLYDRAYDKL